MKKVLFAIVFTFCLFAVHGDSKIMDIENIPIQVNDIFSEQGFTLKLDNNRYFVLREYYGSGVDVACRILYDVNLVSDYQIDFDKINHMSSKQNVEDDKFILRIENDEVELFINGLQIEIVNKIELVNTLKCINKSY